MESRTKIIIAVVVIVGIALLCGVILASVTETFLFTENLLVDEFKSEEEGSFAADVLDDGVRVANIYVRAGQAVPQTLDIPVLVSIWHSQDTELDSLFLKFSGANQIEVYLEVPGGSWPPVHLYKSSDGKGAIFEVEDLGVQGAGTVTLRFLLKPFSEQESFYFETRFSMHKEAFLQLTRQQAWKLTEIPIST